MSFWRGLSFVGVVFLIGIGIGIGVGVGVGVASEGEAVDALLTNIVYKQQAAWNRGDIDGFMQAYWKSDKLTFSSRGETRRGWETTRKKYLQSYPDKATMGKLTFSSLEVDQLSEDVAMMLGEWQIVGEKPAEGNFSLVWRKIDGMWVIVHDHSSSREPK